MSAEAIREKVGGEWTERPDGWWLRLETGRVRAAAEAMLQGGARFVALVGVPAGSGSLRLSWHWDVNGALLSVESSIAKETSVPSIAGIYPGADWAERELRDYYAVTFEGRASTPSLMLREGDPPGVMVISKGEDL